MLPQKEASRKDGSSPEEEGTVAGVWGVPKHRGAPSATGKLMEGMGRCRDLACWASPRGAVQSLGSEDRHPGRSGHSSGTHTALCLPIAPRVLRVSHSMSVVLSAQQGKLKNPMHEIQSQNLVSQYVGLSIVANLFQQFLLF